MTWLIAALTTLLGIGASSASAWQKEADKMLALPGCQPKRVCVGVDVHLLRSLDQVPVRDAAWLGRHLDVARRLFSPINVDFYIRSVSPLPVGQGEVLTREDRDAFLRQAKARDGIDLFMVKSLADVDVKGAFIRGVHWRRRDDVSKRWVILSSIAQPEVMAHEFGHFFGLPHSRYRVSIMNKSPRKNPPWSARVFAKPEQKKMARHRDKMLRSGRLRATPRSPQAN